MPSTSNAIKINIKNGVAYEHMNQQSLRLEETQIESRYRIHSAIRQ
jgi:hypothetical protein